VILVTEAEAIGYAEGLPNGIVGQFSRRSLPSDSRANRRLSRRDKIPYPPNEYQIEQHRVTSGNVGIYSTSPSQHLEYTLH
jgi:hypothetical protein